MGAEMKRYQHKQIQGVTHHAGATACLCLLIACQQAYGNPVNGQVVSGSATIRNSRNTTTITQITNKAIINWQDFSIGAGQTTQFVQPSSSSMTLNRVVGGNPSVILGNLKANGTIYIINGNGILFGAGSNVDVGGLVASTAQITNKSFLSGTQQFTRSNNPNASVINEGTITVRDTGLVALVSPTVINQGVISANLGTVQIASADHFTLDLYGDGLIALDAGPQLRQGLIDNEGSIQAHGGSVLITAQAAQGVLQNVINMNGYIDASSVNAQGGAVVLKGYGNTQMNLNGIINVASPTNLAGLVQATAQTINLGADSLINATGYTGGGTVNIGGGLHGGGTLAHADFVNMAPGALINADALNSGKGGTVTLWSDENTNAHGSIFARGGASSGDGGLIETSSHNTLDTTGITVDASAAHGLGGTWLIDPITLTITDALAAGYNSTLASGTNVNITTTDGVQFDNTTTNISWSTAADFNVRSNSAANSIASDPNTITYNGGCTAGVTCQVISSGAGNINFYYNPTAYVTPTSFTNFVQTTGSGVFTPYMEVNNATELQNVGTNLAGNYALNANIDASSILNFQSIGGEGNPAFTGQFTGAVFQNDPSAMIQYTISNLTISSPLDYIGLFGQTGSPAVISDIVLTNANIQGTGPLGEVGSIIGYSGTGTTLSGTFSSTNGIVNSTSSFVGGLFGELATGTILSPNVTLTNSGGSVTGLAGTGGLIGVLDSGVTFNSSSLASNSANVTGLSNSGSVGGDIGQVVNSNLTNSFSNSGTVFANPGALTGLTGGIFGVFSAGSSTGALNNTGDVTGVNYVGGIVGQMLAGVTLSNATDSGNTITGSQYTGGIAGYSLGNLSNLTVTNATITSPSYTGGLIGFENGSTVTQGLVRGSTVSGNTNVGGAVGDDLANMDQIAVVNTAINGTGVTPSDIGGIVGQANGPTLSNLEAGGTITIASGGIGVGGIVGINSGGTIQNALSAISITMPSPGSPPGQLVGISGGGSISNSIYDTTVNSFASVNGVGANFGGVITNVEGLPTTALSVFSTYTANGFSPATWQLIPGNYASLIFCGSSCLIPIPATPSPISAKTVQAIQTQITNAETYMNTTSVIYGTALWTAGTGLNIIPGTSITDLMNIPTDPTTADAVNGFMSGTTVLQWLDNTSDSLTTQGVQNYTVGAISDAVKAESKAQGCAVKP